MTIPKLPKEEFTSRVLRTQQKMQTEGFDALIAFGTAAEPQYLRYYADFRVAFETGGVAIPAQGDAELLVGPETLERAEMQTPLPRATKMLAFRELAAPAYEDPSSDTFEKLFERLAGGKELRKVGIVGWRMIPMDIYREIEQALHSLFPKAELAPGDYIADEVRTQKSPLEVEMLRHSARIARGALEHAIANLRVGMTGEEVRGLALSYMIEHGAEGEGFPVWIIREDETEFAISIPTKEAIQKGDLVQIQLGASVNGYSSACGRAVVMGKASPMQRDLIESVIKVKEATEKGLATLRSSGAVANAHRAEAIRLGKEDCLLYGPCHSVGMVECESPWIESATDYELKPGMVFCLDIMLSDHKIHRGCRYEDMALITEDGFEPLTGMPNELIEIDC